jgi:threonine dehydrogenase-like Zn-dependent dehydrogenase
MKGLGARAVVEDGDAHACVAALGEAELVERIRSSCAPDGADVVLEVCGLASAVPTGIHMLRVGGRYVIGGLVNPNDHFTVDGNEILRKLITLRGVHNYHPRHLIQALDFVMANRVRFPFKDLVDSKFTLEQLDQAFARAAERSVLRAAVVP